jgi:hypothetical protein
LCAVYQKEKLVCDFYSIDGEGNFADVVELGDFNEGLASKATATAATA